MLGPQFVVHGLLHLQRARYQPAGIDAQLRALGTQFVVYEVAVCAV